MIYPKLRVSWTLFKLWITHDWVGIWEYLTMTGLRRQVAELGIKGHKYLQNNGVGEVEGIEKFIFEKELEYEKKLHLERDGYVIVMKIDLLSKDTVYDYKFGGTGGYEQQLQSYMWGSNRNIAALLPIEWDGEGVMKMGKGVKIYERSRYCDEWENRYYEMQNDINLAIKKGRLHKFLTGGL